MKISYKVLKSYLPYLGTPEQVAEDLIMHTAEVEEIESQGKTFENIVYGKITSVQAHENADSLKVCMVDVWEQNDIQIVCGGSNLAVWQGVAVAKIGASVVWHGQGDPIVMKKTAIRGVESFWMICASEEIGLAEDFPSKSEKEILDLSYLETKTGTNLGELLWKDGATLIIDNKAINHRPDMFSHIGVIRELATIHGQKTPLDYIEEDFSQLPKFPIKNEIPNLVKRYIGLSISGVDNRESPEEIQHIVETSGNTSKWILIDITNYSLFFYWQPTHCFDRDKIEWGEIIVRMARDGETFLALDNKEYTLTSEDIVIADSKKILALWGVIGGKESAVSESTKNIVVESANFPDSILRHTGRRLGIRTDALNIFEKNIPTWLQIKWVSLIYKKLKDIFPNLQLDGFGESYEEKQEWVSIAYDKVFINNLIGKEYSDERITSILHLLGIETTGGMCFIPFWRTDMRYKADIAEEIARIDGYHTIEMTVPRINLWAISQDASYDLKQESRKFFTSIGFFDVYNYSFVNSDLMKKLGSSTENLIEMKNYLSEEVTHMRNTLIANLMKWLEENRKEQKNCKLFEIEKVFWLKNGEIYEALHLGGVMISDEDIPYYTLQKIISSFFKIIGIDKYSFEKPRESVPTFAHTGRIAEIWVRGKKVWFLWEISPKIAANFDLEQKVAFFEINADILAENAFKTPKAREISNFQENNFDLSFVLSKETLGKNIKGAIEKTDTTLIKKVELFDVYENEEKLPWKRSISYKIYIQSDKETLDDTVKNSLISQIVKNVEKVGGNLR
jgi:phenylalanyl-tRNA synthetase beta chain